MSRTDPDSATFRNVPSHQRALAWAYARTLRDLRLSIARGRPISLPNLTRLYARRAGELYDARLGGLRELYVRHQPFYAMVPFLRPQIRPIPQKSH
jgi:hypothetical protein